MSRLIAFGCNHTYGHGLPDCFDPIANTPRLIPSRIAWPHVLGSLLNLPRTITNVKTCSPDASNTEILYKILNFKYRPGDVVVVLWTHLLRDVIFNEKNLLKYETSNTYNIGQKVGPDIEEDSSRDWINAHSLFDCKIRAWMNVHGADAYLRTKNVEHYNFLIEDEAMCNMKNIKIVESGKKITLRNNFWEELRTEKKSLDGVHGGANFHKNVAKAMYQDISQIRSTQYSIICNINSYIGG